MLLATLAYGRVLPDEWEVHHINENRADNKRQNLVICKSKRSHRLLHLRPQLLLDCEWLGIPGKSVRIFHYVDPKGKYLCVSCGDVKPLVKFNKSKKYRSGVRGDCTDCRYASDKAARVEYRKLVPVKPRHWQGLKGEENASSKLTARKVRGIRLWHARGHTRTNLAKRYGVSYSTIRLIVARKRWRHL
jgi:hypothetical protein